MALCSVLRQQELRHWCAEIQKNWHPSYSYRLLMDVTLSQKEAREVNESFVCLAGYIAQNINHWWKKSTVSKQMPLLHTLAIETTVGNYFLSKVSKALFCSNGLIWIDSGELKHYAVSEDSTILLLLT